MPLDINDLQYVANACRLAAREARKDAEAQSSPSIRAIFEESAAYYDQLVERFERARDAKLKSSTHICDRKGKPTEVIDDPDGENLSRITPTCSVCGKPQAELKPLK